MVSFIVILIIHRNAADRARDRGAGTGLYLAEHARYSNGFAHVFREGSQERRQLLLMRTALGQAYEFQGKTHKYVGVQLSWRKH